MSVYCVTGKAEADFIFRETSHSSAVSVSLCRPNDRSDLHRKRVSSVSEGIH